MCTFSPVLIKKTLISPVLIKKSLMDHIFLKCKKMQKNVKKYDSLVGKSLIKFFLVYFLCIFSFGLKFLLLFENH